MEKKDQWNIGYWIVAGLLLLTLQNYWRAAKKVEPVPYSEFEKALAEGGLPLQGCPMWTTRRNAGKPVQWTSSPSQLTRLHCDEGWTLTSRFACKPIS